MIPPMIPPAPSSFEVAIVVVLRHEGGWVDNPDDPGGETNFGISTLMIRNEKLTAAELGLPAGVELFAPGYMHHLTIEKARELYRRLYWDRFWYARISNQAVATKVFDCAVNCGASRAHQFAQRVAGVADDGALGPISIAAINAMAPGEFLAGFSDQMVRYYTHIAEKNPKLVTFLPNWLKRSTWS